MSELPAQMGPAHASRVNRDEKNPFLLRPGQILAGPGDAAEVRRCSRTGSAGEQRAFGVTVFTRTPQNPDDPAREVLDALARIRKATADRPQGPARVAPNHVFVGEAINFYGEPRIQGGPGSSVRQAKLPAVAAAAHEPPRRRQGRAGSRCWTPACSTTSGSRPSRRARQRTTSGTSRATATATPRPATACSSPG